MNKEFLISKEVLSNIIQSSDLIDEFINKSIKEESKAKNKFLLETLKTKAFPKLFGKPNKYSAKWRFLKLEIHQTDEPLCYIWKVKQFGRIINQLKYKTQIRM